MISRNSAKIQEIHRILLLELANLGFTLPSDSSIRSITASDFELIYVLFKKIMADSAKEKLFNNLFKSFIAGLPANKRVSILNMYQQIKTLMVET